MSAMNEDALRALVRDVIGRIESRSGQQPAAEHDFRQALARDAGNRCARLELTRSAHGTETVGATQ